MAERPAHATVPSPRTAGSSSVLELVGPSPKLLLGSAVTGLLVLLLFLAWGYQAKNGLGVAGINRPVFWGFYIVNFVFWIGVSHAGTLISAILRVTGAQWRRPLTRCAEAITVFALMIGGLFPLIHMGRPWLFYRMLPLPDYRELWPNFRSPLQWDLVAIFTYLTGSILYLALPLIPDLALLRDRYAGQHPVLARLYRTLALGWRGTHRQWRALDWGIRILAVAIIPVAVSVHSIVSWDFAMTRVPGWKSTIFAPYFVVGAIYSGIAMLLFTMALLRRGLRLERVLTDGVFDKLGLLFVAMSMLWVYFTFSEHLTTWYGGDVAEARVHHELFHGPLSPAFWTMVVVNAIIPLAVLPFRRGRRPLPIALVSLGVVVGMWLERLLIVVPSLSVPRLAYTVGSYAPSPVEIAITVGAVGLFAFLYFGFVQLFPIVSAWEVREGEVEEEEHAREVLAAEEPA
ncbi:MAG TPA: NrfD/PsrC family molybdoenzyme membrane anchor subunit [Thermoanaerobaculia bacterium]|nr:NrfD/PsrC family molybdoenzyme membrane anchor subunit [Thermoanaerobaculia bacterium]